MAGGKIVGITIDIAGKTSGLVSSLKDADSALSKTNSALKSVNSALKFDSSNVELLTSKSELLSQAIDQNSSRLDVLKETAAQAMETLGQEGGATTEQIAELQAEISRTEQTLAGLETEAANTGAALDEINGDGVGEAADGAEESADALGDMGEAADDASVNLDGLKAAAIAVGTEMVAALGACVKAIQEVGGALINSSVDTGKYVDEMNTLSSVTGISTERLQEMDYAFGGLIDVSLDTVTGSLTKLEKSMSSASDQMFKYDTGLAELNRSLNEGKISQEEYEAAVEELGEKTSTVYDKLGISIYDSNHNLRDSEEVFWEAIDAMGELEDGTERDLVAMELFGKSAKELNPLIEAGSEKFNELAEEAHNVGAVLDEDTMQSYQDFNDQMDRLGKGTEAAKKQLGTVLLPVLTDLSTSGTEAINEFTVAMQNSNGDISKLSPAISSILTKLLGEVNKVAPQIFSLIGDIVNTLLQILIDNLPQIVDTAMSILTALADTLINPENIAKIADAATQIILSLVGYITSNLDQILSAAMMIITSLVNGLSQSLPVIIPAAIDAILTFVDTLLSGDQLALLLEAALTLITSLATGLIQYLPELIKRLPEIISGMVEFLTGDALPDIIEAGVTLITSLVTEMPTIIASIIDSLMQLIADCVSYLTGDGMTDFLGAFTDIFDDLGGMFDGLIEDALTWGADLIQGIIDGITSLAGDLWDTVTDIAGGIADLLGFSVPKKGPLHEWAYNNPGADMLKLYEEGIQAELPSLQNSINVVAQTMTGAAGSQAIDYTGSFDRISGQLGGILEMDRVINVTAQIGDQSFGSAVARANSNNAYVSGGR